MNLLCGVLALAQSVRRSAPEFLGPIAQRLEQTTHNRLVGGSNPSGPTIPQHERSEGPIDLR